VGRFVKPFPATLILWELNRKTTLPRALEIFPRSHPNRKLASVCPRVPESNQLNTRSYGREAGVGRDLGVGVDLGSTVAVAVAVGVGDGVKQIEHVGVGVAVAVDVAVAVAVAVAVDVAVAVGVTVAVGVGVSPWQLLSQFPALTITFPQSPLCVATRP